MSYKIFCSLIVLNLFFSLFSSEKFTLGNINDDGVDIKVSYTNSGKEMIEIYLKSKINPVKLYTIKELEIQIKKFLQWYKTAVETNYVLNKDISIIASYKTRFITKEAGKYQLCFIEKRTGEKHLVLNKTSVIKLLELINRKYIDSIKNKERIKKQKEDELFKN